ncbi:uncharacterized protein LOC117597925 [Pangasianodon hypophthalmus]|nr:uncharacterized protein LOC117597925 [Pangasianodon hypophthalmus]
MKLCISLSLLLGQCVLSAQSAIFDQRITEGSNITIPCENEGRVSWSKLADGKREIILTAQDGGVSERSKPDPDHRYGVFANLSLVIKETSVSDSGTYYCNATSVVKLTVTPLKVSSAISTDDVRASATSITGGVRGVERVLFVSLTAVFFLTTVA